MDHIEEIKQLLENNAKRNQLNFSEAIDKVTKEMEGKLADLDKKVDNEKPVSLVKGGERKLDDKILEIKAGFFSKIGEDREIKQKQILEEVGFTIRPLMEKHRISSLMIELRKIF